MSPTKSNHLRRSISAVDKTRYNSGQAGRTNAHFDRWKEILLVDGTSSLHNTHAPFTLPGSHPAAGATAPPSSERNSQWEPGPIDDGSSLNLGLKG